MIHFAFKRRETSHLDWHPSLSLLLKKFFIPVHLKINCLLIITPENKSSRHQNTSALEDVIVSHDTAARWCV